MKKYFNRIFFSVLIIYGINLITCKIGFYIPINLFSILIFTMLGVPGLIYYILILFLYYR